MPDDFADTSDLAAAAELLWEQAKAQLAGQKAEVDALRTRAVALLSVASLVAGLFASRLPHSHAATRTVVASIAALALFGVSVVLALLIAAPKRRWVFTFTLDELVGRVDQGIARPVDVTSNLTSWAEDARRLNARKLRIMYGFFGAVCLLIGLQVIAWAVAAL
jgi:hypothetical protein